MHLLIALLAFLGLLATPQAAEADLPLVPAQELHARKGLPNFIAKATKPGAALKVAYLGGSITAQNGWRVQSLALLQKTFPEAKLTEIAAAIGGTGSDLGVFRLQQDVLDQKPDLLFVEFAVNDGGASPGQIYRCMEGIVRQTWRALPECDICFVYTTSLALVPPLLEGKFPRAASAMEKVADHYGIPTIQMCMEVARLAKEGNLLWAAPLPKTDEETKALAGKVVFAPDNVHPHPETGHKLYTEAIERSLPGIRAASGVAAPHTLGEPLVPDHYEKAKLLPASEATFSPGVVKLDPAKDKMAQQFGSRLKTLYRAGAAGDTLTFRFKGTRAFVYDIIGPDTGQVIVTVDDKPPVTIARFDSYCTYPRLSMLGVAPELPDGVHTVKIELHKDAPDKAAILAKQNKKIDKPERYQDNAFYPGALLIVGELLK